MSRVSTLCAEFIGTYVLVFGGTGSAVLAAEFLGADGENTGLGIGFLGVSLAFGLTVVTMALRSGQDIRRALHPGDVTSGTVDLPR
jgi:aquaporin Z